jgi:molybdenum transport protein
MNYFTEAEIDQLIHEDLPYFDLTCMSIKLGSKVARISFSTRHNTVICGTEEVLKIFEKFKITPTLISFSGEQLEAGIKFLEGEGLATNLHAICRPSANLLEFSSGIATRTKSIVSLANEVSPCIPIEMSIKSIPFTKKLAIKAIHIGGGSIHNLGLSDAILISDNHLKFIGGVENLIRKIPEIVTRAAGRSVRIEVTNRENALMLAKTNIDALQLDRMSPDVLKELIPDLKKINSGLRIAASGDINETNVKEYASTGADILISYYLQLALPCDFQVHIEPVYELY